MGRRAALIAALAALLASTPAAGARDAQPRAGTVAVGYARSAALADALAGHPGTVVRRLPALRVAEVRPAGDPTAFARAVRALPGIRYAAAPTPRRSNAEPALAPSPTGIAYEWQYAATHADLVPAAVLRAASAVTIAVVDTGADVTAPDLAAKQPLTYSVVSGGSDVRDVNGHGTFVATIAAGAVDNGEGIAGFGGDARLLIAQANRTETSFTDVDEAEAILWAVANGARVINLSIGGPSTSRTERSAIEYAADRGVLLVAAAGNDHDRGNPVEYPAALLQPPGSNGVGGSGLVVGAATARGTRAFFSNSGSYLSLAAPGVDVVGGVSSASSASAYPRLTLPGSLAGLYGLGSGTSYAAPQVAGAAALVWAANPLLTATQVAEVLKDTASNGGRWNPDTGWGVLDVAAAVARAGGQQAAQTAVRLAGRRVGRTVRLSWGGEGAAAYRLSLREDRRAPQVLSSGPATTASYSLAPGHTYVFTVEALDTGGAAVARSLPYRVDAGRPAARNPAARRSR